MTSPTTTGCCRSTSPTLVASYRTACAGKNLGRSVDFFRACYLIARTSQVHRSPIVRTPTLCCARTRERARQLCRGFGAALLLSSLIVHVAGSSWRAIRWVRTHYFTSRQGLWFCSHLQSGGCLIGLVCHVSSIV